MLLALATIVLAASLGPCSSCHSVIVVTESGAAVPAAQVTFFDPRGMRDLEITDAKGAATAHSGFMPVTVRIVAAGYEPQTATLERNGQTVTMERLLPLIGSVRVATGSQQSLHSLPVAASLLDRTALSFHTSPTMDAMLRALPGFDRTRSNSAFTNYGQLRVSFSGAGNDRGLVLVNGIPAQDGFGGQVDWLAYPPGEVERAELLRGAGSWLYGAGAIGGVLDLKTFGPEGSAPASGTLTLIGGTPDLLEQSLNLRAELSAKLGASVSAQSQRLAYYDLPPAYRSPVDEVAQSASQVVAVRLRFAASPQTVVEAGGRIAADHQQEGRPNYTFARRLTQSDLRVSHTTANSVLDAQIYARNAFIVNTADQFPAKPGVLLYVQDVSTGESGAALGWSIESAKSAFRIRADARWIRGETNQYGNAGVLQNAGRGAQLLDGIAAGATVRGKRIEVVVGVRTDSATLANASLINVKGSTTTHQFPLARTDSAVSPLLALRFDLTPRLALRISQGAGFRPPYLNELVRGFVIGSVTFLPNPGLIPERSGTTSAGLDWVSGTQRLSADVMHTIVNNAIMFRTVGANIQQRSNVAQTRTDGITLTYTRSVGSCGRLSMWGTEQSARVTAGPAAIDGNLLQYVPQTSFGFSYDVHTERADLGVRATYLGQTYADDFNTQPLGTAVLVGAHARLHLNGGDSIVINIDNAANAHYLSSVDRYGTPLLVSAGLMVPVGRREPEQPCSAPAP